MSLAPPIIAALITSILGTMLTQFIDRYVKHDREVKKEIRECISKCVNYKIRIKDLFRQLAMYKSHAEYWYSLFEKESYSQKFYDEHLKSKAEARDAEKSIGVIVADFLSEATKYEKLKGKKFDIIREKEAIDTINFQRAGYYIDADREKYMRNEKELREKYFENLLPFKQIIDKME